MLAPAPFKTDASKFTGPGLPVASRKRFGGWAEG